MLNENNYKKGLIVHTLTKYNIDYNRLLLFDIVIAKLVQRLIDCSYSSELTDEQKEILNNLINK